MDNKDLDRPLKRVLQWENGRPTQTAVPALTPDQVQQLAIGALSEIFIDTTGEFPEYDGLPLGAVAAKVQARKAAMGDGKAYNDLLDRAIGRPKQTAEIVKTTLTYEDHLKLTAQKLEGSPELIESAEVIESAPVDIDENGEEIDILQ